MGNPGMPPANPRAPMNGPGVPPMNGPGAPMNGAPPMNGPGAPMNGPGAPPMNGPGAPQAPNPYQDSLRMFGQTMGGGYANEQLRTLSAPERQPEFSMGGGVSMGANPNDFRGGMREQSIGMQPEDLRGGMRADGLDQRAIDAAGPGAYEQWRNNAARAGYNYGPQSFGGGYQAGQPKGPQGMGEMSTQFSVNEEQSLNPMGISQAAMMGPNNPNLRMERGSLVGGDPRNPEGLPMYVDAQGIPRFNPAPMNAGAGLLGDMQYRVGDGFTGTRDGFNYVNGRLFSAEGLNQGGGPQGMGVGFGNWYNRHVPGLQAMQQRGGK